MKKLVLYLFFFMSTASFTITLGAEKFLLEHAQFCYELADWIDHSPDELEYCEDSKEYVIVGEVENEEGLTLAKVQFRAKLSEEGEVLEVFFHVTQKGEVYYMYE
jgi:hypothetical protein